MQRGFTELTIRFFKKVFARQSTTGLLPAKYNLTTVAGDACVRGSGVSKGKAVPVEFPGLGDVIAIGGLGAPIHLPIATGPITVAGVPTLSGTRPQAESTPARSSGWRSGPTRRPRRSSRTT